MTDALPYDVVLDTPERGRWLQERQRGIGSSDMAAILGMSKWGSALSVFADKVAPLKLNEKETPYQRAGRELEPAILRVTAQDVGATRAERRKALLRSREWPFLQVTLDGRLFFGERGEWCECKATSRDEEWETEVPPRITVQMQTQMAVTGAESMVCGVLFAGFSMEFTHFRVERDDPFIRDVIVPCAKAMLDRVRSGVSDGIEIDGSEWTSKALTKLCPLNQEGEAQLGRRESKDGLDWPTVADEIVALRERIKALEARKKLLANEIVAASEGAALVRLPDGRYFNTKRTKNPGYTVEPYEYVAAMGPFGKALS